MWRVCLASPFWLLLMVCSVSSGALAANWYVSVDGTDPTDCENGTVESPWLTWTGPAPEGLLPGCL